MTRTEAIKEAKESSRDGCRYYVLDNGKEAGISGYIDTIGHLLSIGYKLVTAFEDGVELDKEKSQEELRKEIEEYNIWLEKQIQNDKERMFDITKRRF